MKSTDLVYTKIWPQFSTLFRKLGRQAIHGNFLFSSFLSLALSAMLPAEAKQFTVSGISSGAFMAIQMGTIYSSQISGVGTVAGGFFYCAQNHLQEKIEEGRKNPFIGTTNLFLFEQSTELLGDVMSGQALRPQADRHWITPSVGNPIYESVGICMQNPSVSNLPDLKDFESKELIDKTENLKSQRVYIYQGDLDTVVNPTMAKKTFQFYIDNGVAKDLIKVKTLSGGHNFPTDTVGLNDCKAQSVPYISSCQFNLAEDMLQHLLGKKLLRSVSLLKNLYRVDQNLDPINEKFKPDAWQAPTPTLASYGYLYASQKCLDQPETCDLHVALHGCEMSDSFDSAFDKRYSEQVAQTKILGMRTKEQRSFFSALLPAIEERKLQLGTLKFAIQSGYIELAENNDLMILFPQTWITTENYPYNPKGCWDWYGANDSNYATKKGIETSWLIEYAKKIMVDPKKYIMSTKPEVEKLKN